MDARWLKVALWSCWSLELELLLRKVASLRAYPFYVYVFGCCAIRTVYDVFMLVLEAWANYYDIYSE